MENKQFFDPYNFNNMLLGQNQTTQKNFDDTQFTQMPGFTPTMFYEQQYWYYNYLTKMLEYKIKLKEYESICKKQPPT